MSEADFQRAIIKGARMTGWQVYHSHDSRREVARAGGVKVLIGDADAKGFPDLVLVHPRRQLTLFRELKAEKGRVTVSQQQWIVALTAAGQDAKVWRPSDMNEIELTLTGRKRR